MRSKSIKKSCLLFFLLIFLSLNISHCLAGEFNEFEEKLKSNSTEGKSESDDETVTEITNEIEISSDHDPDAEIINQTLVDAHPKLMENDDGGSNKKGLAFTTEFGLDQNYDQQVDQSSNSTGENQEIELESTGLNSTDPEKIQDFELDSVELNSTEEIQDTELDSEFTGSIQGEASSSEDRKLENETLIFKEELDSELESLESKINFKHIEIKGSDLEESLIEELPIESEPETSTSKNKNESFEEFHNFKVEDSEEFDDLSLFDIIYGRNDSTHQNHTIENTRIIIDNENMTLDFELENELDHTNNSVVLGKPDLVIENLKNSREIIFEPDEETRASRNHEIFDTENEDPIVLFEENFSTPFWVKKWRQYLVTKSYKTRNILKHKQGKFKFTQGQMIEANDGRKFYQIWTEISSRQSLGKILKISYKISTTSRDCTVFQMKLYKCPEKWTFKSWKPPPLLVMENLDCYNHNNSHVFSTGLGFGHDIRNKTKYKDFDIELGQLNTYTLEISDEGQFQMRVNGLVVENGFFMPEAYTDLNQMCRLDLYLVKQRPESIFQIDDILVVTYK